MFTVGVPRPTFYLLHSLYYTQHFCVMHIQTLNITVPHACYRLLLVQHYSFIHCKDVEQEASHCILRERLCVLAVPVWVLPAYLQRAQPYVNYKAVHHTRPSYTKEPLISKHGTWITSISPLTCLPLWEDSLICVRWEITGQSSSDDIMPFASFIRA